MNKLDSPLDLANWAKSSSEARMRASGNPASTFKPDSLSSQERRLQLIQAFNDIDRDGSGKLSIDEIFSYLKDLNDKADDNYIRAIFQSMDENKDGQVSIEEFVSTYLNQVNSLSEASAQLRQQIQERRRDLNQFEAQLQDSLKSERINSWGIMEGSILTLKVIEAQNLVSLTGRPSSYVSILCEKQQIATNVAMDQRNPSWNEEFSFKVAAGNGEMVIQVFDKTSNGDELLGICKVQLEEFRDQAKHEKWFHLESRTNTARVLMTVQWIHRKTQYLKEKIEMLKKEIKADGDEQEKITAEMMKLGTNPSGMFKKESWVDRLEVKVVQEVQEFPDQHFSVRTRQRFGSLDSAQKILVLIFTAISIISTLKRPDLSNLTWASLFWSKELSCWTIQTYRYSIGFLFLLVLYDFIWVIANFDYLVFSIHQDPEINLHRFCFLTGLFGLILKVPILIVIIKNFIIFKEMDCLKVFNR